tara:strand:- start:2280 stop:3290 length:1011 start_codon:yes stop_codon:yes gene_type:complete
MLFIFLSLFNFILFFNLDKISQIFNIYDSPDGKLKLHKKKTPLIGGIILIANFSIIFLYQIFFLDNFLSLNSNDFESFELLSLIILIYSLFFLGLYDDKYNLAPFKKLLLTILIILISIFINQKLVITNFTLSFYGKRIFFENMSTIFTIFCILILINALNFYDGINGQSCIIFLVFFTYLLFISNFNFFYLYCIILILIITYYNFQNRLFLGDSGVYLLSIILSTSLIYEYNIHKNIIYADEIFFLLLLPGFDLLRLTIIRSFNSKSPFFGDRDHIHHLLIDKFSLVFSNIILFLLSILPIFLFIFSKQNFFLVISIFSITYFFLILFLKSNDKK